MTRLTWMLLLAVSCVLGPGVAGAQGGHALDGTWVGPWYRGMSSGVATLRIDGGTGTLQLTNAESFGEEPRPLVKLVVKGDQVSLRADGNSGAPLTVELKANAAGDQMKGMGKYEGFGVRMELRRTGS
jgi:hypothetical protein